MAEETKKPEAENSTNECDIIFYCKDCNEIVETDRCGRKYVYKCKKCGTKNVAFGTRKSIYSFFKIEEDSVRRRKVKEGSQEIRKSEPKA